VTVTGSNASELARRRRVRTLRLFVAPLVVLASVLVALAAGCAPNRLRPVAGFLAVAAAASTYIWATARRSLRRARHQKQSDIPWNVRLTKPFWLILSDALTLLFPGAVLGAVAAIFGFPGIGLGALLTFAALSCWLPLVDFGMNARGLTFEEGGLRVHSRGASFVVPWTSIIAVERLGPENFLMVRLRLREAQAVVESATPNGLKARARAERFVRGIAPEGQVMFMPWTAGISGAALARTIDAAIGGTTGKVN
jgi:hypothetical protein